MAGKGHLNASTERQCTAGWKHADLFDRVCKSCLMALQRGSRPDFGPTVYSPGRIFIRTLDVNEALAGQCKATGGDENNSGA